MRKISEVKLSIRHRNGYPAPMNYLDILADGHSLYEIYALEHDFVSCLGWGSQDFQTHQISRLLLNSKPDDIGSRYSLFICPVCADLGCGAISLNIKDTASHIYRFLRPQISRMFLARWVHGMIALPI